MEKKKKIILLTIFIIIITILFIVYIINTITNEEIDLNNILLEGEKNDVNIENSEKVENTKITNEIGKEEEQIVIHIIGEVKKEGIIYLKKGSRVADAIKEAGGETREADLSKINLAYVLEDGEKIYVPNENDKITEYITQGNGNNVISEGSKTSNNLKGENSKVNINTATLNELDSLPGIGPSTAQKIIDYREKNGNFEKIEDLQNVKGIGDAKYEGIKDRIIV